MKILKLFVLCMAASFLLSCKKPVDLGADILIIGDSWAQLMCLFQSFPKALKAAGIEKSVSCLTTTKAGARASDWASDKGLRNIDIALAAHKKAKYIYVSLGGNDFFNIWHVGLSEQEKKHHFQQIQDNLIQIVNRIKANRPQATIVLSSYDYPNFEYLMQTQFASAYVKLFKEMGEPTPEQLHKGNAEFEMYKMRIAEQFSNVKYVNNAGLMQYYLGQSEQGIPPGTTPFPGQAPDYFPLLGGHPEIWSPVKAFLGVELTPITDPYHLNNEGFFYLAGNILKYAPVP